MRVSRDLVILLRIKDMKMEQSEIKHTLTAIKNNLQEFNIEYRIPRIKPTIWIMRNQKTPNQKGKKRKKCKNMQVM